jgi:hypothetical protein
MGVILASDDGLRPNRLADVRMADEQMTWSVL